MHLHFYFLLQLCLMRNQHFFDCLLSYMAFYSNCSDSTISRDSYRNIAYVLHLEFLYIEQNYYNLADKVQNNLSRTYGEIFLTASSTLLSSSLHSSINSCISSISLFCLLSMMDLSALSIF